MGNQPSEQASRDDLTILLRQMANGDAAAAERASSLVYEELRRLAQSRLSREDRNNSLNPTLLVNEVFLRLLRVKEVNWNDRGHFFTMAARMMRRLVIDHFRERRAAKRPTSAQQISIDDVIVFDEERCEEALIVNEALDQLEVWDARAAEVVRLRYFGGLTVEQTAETLNVNVRTVKRDWTMARTWLQILLRERSAGPHV